jgi:hypothetical protein
LKWLLRVALSLIYAAPSGAVPVLLPFNLGIPGKPANRALRGVLQCQLCRALSSAKPSASRPNISLSTDSNRRGNRQPRPAPCPPLIDRIL